MAMELKKIYCVGKIFVLFCVLIIILGCQRAAYVDIYNNTNIDIKIDLIGPEEIVLTKQRQKLLFGSDKIIIESDLGIWNYVRKIPHSGEYGKYFNGTLSLQLEENGNIFVLQSNDKAPVYIENYHQPNGYPLVPKDKNQ